MEPRRALTKLLLKICTGGIVWLPLCARFCEHAVRGQSSFHGQFKEPLGLNKGLRRRRIFGFFDPNSLIMRMM